MKNIRNNLWDKYETFFYIEISTEHSKKCSDLIYSNIEQKLFYDMSTQLFSIFWSNLKNLL